MRGHLALLAIAVARLAASRARSGAVTLRPADPTVEALRGLLEEHFRKERQLGFYAEKLAMTPDRLNDIIKRATGVTAGHLIRQPCSPRRSASSFSPAWQFTRSPTI